MRLRQFDLHHVLPGEAALLQSDCLYNNKPLSITCKYVGSVFWSLLAPQINWSSQIHTLCLCLHFQFMFLPLPSLSKGFVKDQKVTSAYSWMSVLFHRANQDHKEQSGHLGRWDRGWVWSHSWRKNSNWLLCWNWIIVCGCFWQGQRGKAGEKGLPGEPGERVKMTICDWQCHWLFRYRLELTFGLNKTLISIRFGW